MSHYDQLREYVFSLEIIDTHTHVAPREERRNQQTDVLAEYLTHYFSCDLVSAGLAPADLEIARDSSKPLMDRWRLVEPFWQTARSTGYGRCLDLTAHGLYGIEGGIRGQNLGELDVKFRAARAAGGWYHRVYKEKSNIRLAVMDCGTTDCDPAHFRPAIRLDDAMLIGQGGLTLANIARRADMKAIHSLGDMEEAFERIVDREFAAGAVCLKSGLAYVRRLRYDKTTRAAAEEQFNLLFHDRNSMNCPHTSLGDFEPLQNFLMHTLCRIADARGLTFEIHTGLQEGNGNLIYQAEPSQLSNLFMEYRNVKFDLFHIGYPYEHTLSALAKNFQNVYIDFAWAHIISPTAAVSAMVEYLDAVPANKISGFGDDYCFIDGVYGHQHMARENIARALAIKIDQGTMGLDRAKEIAHMLLWDNPVRLFGLEKIV